jgi:hypothetical protein
MQWLNKYHIAWAAGTAWTTLGFWRGMKQYDYEYSLKNNDKPNPTPYMYTERIGNGLLGVIVYMNPFLGFLALGKELYRLEINIRNLEDSKNNDTYRRL